MQITKLEHSGIAIEKAGQTIIFDPVEFEHQLPPFDNVIAIIITHKHGDHYQPEILQSLIAQHPQAKVITTPDNVENIAGAEVANPGSELTLGDFNLKFFSKNHAAIIPGEIPCDNLGVVIDDDIVNPSDSFDLPDGISPNLLLVALAAPWCRVSEAMDYIRQAQPKKVIPVHDALLSDFGKQVYGNWLKTTCDEIGCEWIQLSPGKSIEI